MHEILASALLMMGVLEAEVAQVGLVLGIYCTADPHSGENHVRRMV